MIPYELLESKKRFLEWCEEEDWNPDWYLWDLKGDELLVGDWDKNER